MNGKRLTLSSMLALILVMAPFSTVFGQTDEEVILGNLYTSSTTSTSVLAVAGGVVLTVMLVGRESTQQVALYMEQNAVAVQHDLYMGGGETARDLAGIFNVQEQHLDAFANLLFEHRDELAALSQPGEITETTALQFTELVVQGMLRDQALAGSARQLLG